MRSRVVYFRTLCAEGSRHRRRNRRVQVRGTQTCGVDPDREPATAGSGESGAGTAFLTPDVWRFARVTQHHPCAEHRAKHPREHKQNYPKPPPRTSTAAILHDAPELRFSDIATR